MPVSGMYVHLNYFRALNRHYLSSRQGTTMNRSVLFSCLVVFAFWGSGQAARHQQSANSWPPLHPAQRAFLDQYCVTCHSQRAKTAGLLLDQSDLTHIGENAEMWEKVVRKLR